MAISDLEAVKAIERLCRAAPRNLDLEALRVWIAGHCGLNPHAAGPLDPDAPLLAERDKLAASLAAMRDKAERLAALLAATETRSAELAASLAAAKKAAKRPRKSDLSADNAETIAQSAHAPKGKPARNAYMRELMRKRRAEVIYDGPRSTSRGRRGPAYDDQPHAHLAYHNGIIGDRPLTKRASASPRPVRMKIAG
jgi:hypothetical protein